MKDKRNVRLCPLRRMKPCDARCAWRESNICAVQNLSQEVFFAVDALRGVVNVLAGTQEMPVNGDGTEAPPWNT